VIDQIEIPVDLNYVAKEEWWPEQAEREQQRKKTLKEKFLSSKKT